MKRELISVYRCPGTGGELELKDSVLDGDDIASGTLVSRSGHAFSIVNGLPNLVWPSTLPRQEQATLQLYGARADVYDRYLPLTFATFKEDEGQIRSSMVDLLRVSRGKRVLEIGAGTGRDSEIIADRLGPDGELFCQDLSPAMLAENRKRFATRSWQPHFSLANAMYLPFPDNYFDAVFQFGGVGEFSDVSRFFHETVRVVKPGGRVVVGDESMPSWLRETEFAKILTFTNKQFAAPLPLDHLPVEARNVHLRWIIGGTFYLIDFTVGEGEPYADFDFSIPGVRGGTHRTRYYGQLEGVTPETKQLALRARQMLGVSMHEWLETIVRREAEKVLKGKS